MTTKLANLPHNYNWDFIIHTNKYQILQLPYIWDFLCLGFSHVNNLASYPQLHSCVLFEVACVWISYHIKFVYNHRHHIISMCIVWAKLCGMVYMPISVICNLTMHRDFRFVIIWVILCSLWSIPRDVSFCWQDYWNNRR